MAETQTAQRPTSVWERAAGLPLVLVLGLLVLLTRLPGLVSGRTFNTDEATLGVGGRALRSGGSLYVDVIDRKPPLPFAAYAAFGTAKAAIEQLVRYLAVEGGPHGIRANCVCGGVVLTDLFKEIPEWEAIAAAAGERSPLGRALDPDEIGEPAAFLLSEEARMVTGQTLCVDAGFTLPG